MPSRKNVSAAFKPIPPNFDLKRLVEESPKFEYVQRFHCSLIKKQGLERFERAMLRLVVLGATPVVIEGFQDELDKNLFNLHWLRDNCGLKPEQARNLSKQENLPLSIAHYLNHMPALANQWSPENYEDPNRQRVYLKDIDCPGAWRDELQHIIPPGLFYMNESTGDRKLYGDQSYEGSEIASAGDLMSCLPPKMRAENLMCYIGHEGTYTPAHKEMCASLGHNIMVEASGTEDEDGNPTIPGSSIWFLAAAEERFRVSEYWLSALGHDIEVEDHFAQIDAWKDAPFKTYVIEQKVGDLILIPPLAAHQVWNRGTRTMKVAWNRITPETLRLALTEVLPRVRLVCRDEQYKTKATVYYSLRKYSSLLALYEAQMHGSIDISAVIQPQHHSRFRYLKKNFISLLFLYHDILLSENFFEDEDCVEYLPYDSCVTCSYCRCNIFNRFLTCPSCAISSGEDRDPYDVCMECYVMGRSCGCISKLQWVEQFKWSELVKNYEKWRQQAIFFATPIDEVPPSFEIACENTTKKSLAAICQGQLKLRPRNGITVIPTTDVGEEAQHNDEGLVTKRRKLKHKNSTKENLKQVSCHMCKGKKEPFWKMAFCSSCNTPFCYRSLWRKFELMPQTVMENPDWKCPKCLKTCSCRECTRKPGYEPFSPTESKFGYNTKKIADPRSVESLVDFSYSRHSKMRKSTDGSDVNAVDIVRPQDGNTADLIYGVPSLNYDIPFFNDVFFKSSSRPKNRYYEIKGERPSSSNTSMSLTRPVIFTGLESDDEVLSPQEPKERRTSYPSLSVLDPAMFTDADVKQENVRSNTVFAKPLHEVLDTKG